jgi:hypothetical protein
MVGECCAVLLVRRCSAAFKLNFNRWHRLAVCSQQGPDGQHCWFWQAASALSVCGCGRGAYCMHYLDRVT